ncbi:signal peptidase I [Actinoplanes sp. NPDC049668]|uniref:signal peptidase I n=1 Tax=unclassified Actinoplanes TaxID=2626549 RepID=UPI0033B208E9
MTTTTAGLGWPEALRMSISRAALWALTTLAMWAVVLVPFGFDATVIVSGSMSPRVRVGDIVVTKDLDESTELLGKVVTVDNPARPGTLLTHRIVAINPDGTYITQGDANPTPDLLPVHRDAVRGRAFLLVPWVGMSFMWARQHDVLPLVLTVAGFAGLLAGVQPAGRSHLPGFRRNAVLTLAVSLVAGASVIAPATVNRSSAAAYTATVVSAANSFAAGHRTPSGPLVTGATDPLFTSGDPTFSVPGAQTLTRTISVTYDPAPGSYQPDLRLYAANASYTGSGTDVAKWLHIVIERVDGASATTVYNGTLADLNNNHGRWAPIDLGWTPSARQTLTFRFTVTLDAPQHNTNAGTVTTDLRWFDVRNQWVEPQVLSTANASNTWSYRPPAAGRSTRAQVLDDQAVPLGQPPRDQ